MEIRQAKPKVGRGVVPNSNRSDNPNKTGPNRVHARTLWLQRSRTKGVGNE